MENNNWKKYPDVRPTEYGKYEVYRQKCGKQQYQTWNNTGWAYDNNDITHWRKIISPVEAENETTHDVSQNRYSKEDMIDFHNFIFRHENQNKKMGEYFEEYLKSLSPTNGDAEELFPYEQCGDLTHDVSNVEELFKSINETLEELGFIEGDGTREELRQLYNIAKGNVSNVDSEGQKEIIYFNSANNRFISIFHKLLKGEITEEEINFAKDYAKKYEQSHLK